MAMFQIDDAKIQKLEKDLKFANEKALPFATRNTLNKAAFIARSISQSNIRSKMVTRNKWTEKSIQVERSNTLRISNQTASVGSTEAYMEDQEFGGSKVSRGREGTPIPTAYSAGQGRSSFRSKLPRKANKLQNIALRKFRGRRPKNRKQEHLFKVQQAVKTGKRYYYHEFDNGTKGIFRVIGGSRRIKRGWPSGAKIEMVYDMSRKSVRIPANPWLRPAVDKTIPHIQKIYQKSLEFQLKRLGLFK